MKLYKTSLLPVVMVLAFGMAITSCQKLYRPTLGEIVKDPDPPPYNALKNFWAFENNTTDQGESKISATTKDITYVAGIKGQAVKFGPSGYVLIKGDGDTTKYPNGFVGLPKDTLTNLGNFTISFWMNVPGPVNDGAQGVFSFSNKKEFWGNFDMFLENSNPADPSEAFIKFHRFNAGPASGLNERWTEFKVAGVYNKWTHIAITYDATNSMLSTYVDGAVKDSRSLADGATPYGPIKFNDFNGLVLGTHQFMTTPSLTDSHGAEGWAKHLNGAMDQFRIYNRPLSAAEITALFNAKD
jgi:hypothetical protein